MLANVLFPFIHNYVTNKIHVSFYFFSYSLLKKNKNPLTHESGKSLCSRVQENAILHKDSANTMHNYNVYLNVKAEVCTHICVCALSWRKCQPPCSWFVSRARRLWFTRQVQVRKLSTEYQEIRYKYGTVVHHSQGMKTTLHIQVVHRQRERESD